MRLLLCPPALLFVSACAQGGGGGQKTPSHSDTAAPEAEPLLLSDLSVSAGEIVPSVNTVRWTTSAPASSEVTVWRAGEVAARFADSALSAAHSLPLFGLKAGQTYAVQVRSVSAEGAEASADGGLIGVAPKPDWLPELTATSLGADAGGFLLLSLISDAVGGAVIVDRDGDVVWWAKAGEGVLSTANALRAGGGSVLISVQEPEMGTDQGGVLEVALDGTWSTLHAAPGLHHAFTELPDGALAYLGAQISEVAGERVLEDTVEIVDAAGAHRRLFRGLDHFALSAPCSHYAPVGYADGATDWLHANAIAWSPEAEAILFMARNFDALIALDPGTGEPLWQVGGADSALDWADPDEDPWDHPHFSQLAADGIRVMDNGSHRDPEASRAAEYKWDFESGEIALVWDYWDPEGRYIPAIGDVKALYEQRRLVSWSIAGLVTELDGDEVVWQLETALGWGTGQVTWIPDEGGGAR